MYAQLVVVFECFPQEQNAVPTIGVLHPEHLEQLLIIIVVVGLVLFLLNTIHTMEPEAIW